MLILADGTSKPMFRRILVPIDGSAPGFELSERAINLASMFNARLYVVFVEALAPGFTPGGLAQAPSERAVPEWDDEAKALAYVGEKADENGVDYKTARKRGERHLAILHAARDANADLIVLRSPDRHLWRRLPITTANRVLRHASASVLTIEL